MNDRLTLGPPIVYAPQIAPVRPQVRLWEIRYRRVEPGEAVPGAFVTVEEWETLRKEVE